MNGITDIMGQYVGDVIGLPVVVVLLRALVTVAIVLWLASAWWTWRDAGARTRNPFVPYLAAAGVVLASPLAFALAIVVYRVVRPPLTVEADAAAQLQLAMLEEEVRRPACGACGSTVQDEWVACPECGTRLAVRCASCGRALDLDWSICAWCAAEVPWASPDTGGPSPMREPVTIPIRPGGRPLVPVMAVPEGDSGDGAAGPHATSARRAPRTPRTPRSPRIAR